MTPDPVNPDPVNPDPVNPNPVNSDPVPDPVSERSSPPVPVPVPVPVIGFAPPPITEELVEAVGRVLRSGWITSGPELAAFEAELAGWLEAPAVVALSSWTTACELALRWFGVGAGDEVIVPAVTYAATANIVLHCGAEPVFVDIDPATGVVRAEDVARAMTPRTKAVMPVDLAGWPVDYDAIGQVLADFKDFRAATPQQEQLGRPLFLADAAHSFGARWRGKPVATQADITGFSFHAVKNLTTAEGGALAFNLPAAFDLEETVRWFKVMSLHGATKDALAKTRGASPHYDIIDAGFKCNMTDIQAAMGRVQLRHYDATLARRREICERYAAFFGSLAGCLVPPLQDDRRESAYHLFMLRIEGIDAARRDAIMARVREQGIATNIHFPPLPSLSVHKNRPGCPPLEAFPGALEHWNSEISLPVHLELTDADVERICQVVASEIERERG